MFFRQGRNHDLTYADLLRTVEMLRDRLMTSHSGAGMTAAPLLNLLRHNNVPFKLEYVPVGYLVRIEAEHRSLLDEMVLELTNADGRRNIPNVWRGW